MRRLAVLLLATLVPAAPAAAAPSPDRAALISAQFTEYPWDGQRATAAAPQQSANGFDPNLCTKDPDYYCDITHVKLDAADGTTAKLQFDIFDFSVAFADFDISIFHSDENATPGEFIANGGNLSAAGLEETVIIEEAEPGYYLVTVSYYFSPDASYKGTIKGSGITPRPDNAAPAAPPTPAAPGPGPATAPPKVHVRSVKRRGRTVTVRLDRPAPAAMAVTLHRRGKLVARGKVKKGARTVKLKAKRKLAAGRYELRVGGSAGTVRLR